MNKIPYTKPPLTVQEHIELLKTRGLQIPNEERATRYLHNISNFHVFEETGWLFWFMQPVHVFGSAVLRQFFVE